MATGFSAGVAKSGKAARGATAIDTTPIAIRSHDVDLAPGFEDRIRGELAGKLGYAASLIERGTVRFEDVNGPKGGVDTVCRIKLVMSGLPSIVVAETAVDPETAFGRAVPALVHTLGKTLGKHGLRAGRPRRNVKRTAPARRETLGPMPEDPGELIGRRVGHGPAALKRALARPEKQRRDAYVDTALPGVSASDRRAGGPTTARRNAMAHAPRATAALEDSRTRPSRKSTRKSANRAKLGETKSRTVHAAARSAKTRATRAISRAGRGR